MLRYLFLLLFSSFFLYAFGQERIYRGSLRDATTNEPLVFVSIQQVGTTAGTVSDLDGHFEFAATPSDQLIFSYVGYEDLTITLTENTVLPLFLESTAISLTEVVVRPTENPAWRIIRAVIANRNQNDPQQYPGYSYHAYHKTVMSIDTISGTEAFNQTAFPQRLKSPERLQKDAARQALFQNDMHLWLTETYSENYFRAPQQRLEKILASQSSLPNDFTGGINPINFQPFGFYQKVIRLEFSQQNYVNPISKGTFQHYHFQLADTIVHAQDTTFVIQFQPLKGKFFTALKGLLYVNTDGYALENVIAEPADKQQTVQFVLQQQSSRINGHWFPEQLHADLYFQMGVSKLLMSYAFRNRSILSAVELEVPPARLFNHYLKETAPNTPTLHDSLRIESLTRQEKNTYIHWDSLPELRQANRILKSYNSLVRIASSGLISGKKVDFVVPDLLQINARESVRLGLGLKTSPNLSSWLSLYGFAGYGLKDKSWKYGGVVESKLYAHRDLRLRFRYEQDLLEPGSISYLSATNQPWTGWSARSLLLSRLDQRGLYRAAIVYRPSGAWQLNAFWEQEERQLTYEYAFSEDSSLGLPTYRSQNYGLRLRWAAREQLIKMEQLEAILYPSYPVVDFSVARRTLTNKGGAFLRLAARLQHEQRWKYLGTTNVNLQTGWLSQSVPYPYLFQAPGNGGNSLGGNSFFQVAGLTEFTQQQFAFLFIDHNFGTLLGRIRSPYFRPELRLMQNIGWGQLSQPEQHQGLALQDMNNGYYESGIGIDNLLRLPYFKLIYLGLGSSLYYRWGAYQLPDWKDNISLQFSLRLSL